MAIHDKIYSDFGLGFLASLLDGLLDEQEQSYVRIEPGQDL